MPKLINQALCSGSTTDRILNDLSQVAQYKHLHIAEKSGSISTIKSMLKFKRNFNALLHAYFSEKKKNEYQTHLRHTA